MKKPFVNHPGTNPQGGDGHRSVNIRYGGSSVSIKCRDRDTAEKLGRALIGVFNRYLDEVNTDIWGAVTKEVTTQREEACKPRQ